MGTPLPRKLSFAYSAVLLLLLLEFNCQVKPIDMQVLSIYKESSSKTVRKAPAFLQRHVPASSTLALFRRFQSKLIVFPNLSRFLGFNINDQKSLRVTSSILHDLSATKIMAG